MPGTVLGDEDSDLFRAAFAGDPQACRTAVHAGANVNVRTNADIDGIGTGGTALHIAAARGHVEVAAQLIGAGADARAPSGRHETPIQIATRNGHVSVVQLLHGVGAAPNDPEASMKLLKSAPAWDRGTKRQLTATLSQQSGQRAGGRGGDRNRGIVPAPPPKPAVSSAHSVTDAPLPPSGPGLFDQLLRGAGSPGAWTSTKDEIRTGDDGGLREYV